MAGLSHDGDLGAGNTCKKESNEGSVMAPMVAATFSYFHWSSCSAGEYHFKSNDWKCMKNKPKELLKLNMAKEDDLTSCQNICTDIFCLHQIDSSLNLNWPLHIAHSPINFSLSFRLITTHL